MLDILPFDAADWYWVVAGDESKWWSSAAGAYVDPQTAVTWTAVGGQPTYIANETELSDVLRRYGLVGPVVTAQDVKDEARRRILAVYPDWKQANMTARGVELIQKLAQGGTWSPEESAEAAALEAAWDWIKSVRASSDAIEAQSPIPQDYCDDSRWPAIPEPG